MQHVTVSQAIEWYTALPVEQRTAFNAKAKAILMQWFTIQNKQGLLPAMHYYKEANRTLPPLQRGMLSIMLEKMTHNAEWKF